MYALKDKSGWVEFTGRKLPALDYVAPEKPEPVPGRPETVTVDVNEFWVAPELPDEDKRAKFGLHRVLTSPVPDGKRVVSWRLEDDGGEPRKVDAYEDFTAEEIAAIERSAKDAEERQAARLDNFVKQFVGMTPAQVEAYIDANVTTLAGARGLLKKMGIMLLILARNELR